MVQLVSFAGTDFTKHTQVQLSGSAFPSLLNCSDDRSIVFVSGADGVALYVDDVSGTLFSDTEYPGCVSIEMAIA